MRFNTIKYFINEGFSGLKKNLLMTVASILAVAACISILSFSYSIGSNLQHSLKQMEDSIGISIFLKDDLTAERIQNLQKEILSIEHVTEVRYISPDEALDSLKDDWGADEQIFEGLDSENNPLSHSFQISLDDIKSQSLVLKSLEAVDGIDNVRHGATETELITKVSTVFNVASVLVMLILGGISVMIIMNTIRISVVNRRNEIGIMKYVGATDWFIRWPFIVEGVIIGLVGAVVPAVLGMPIYAKIVSTLYEYLPVIKMVQLRTAGDIYAVLFPVAIIFGVGLGVVGSVTSIRKHLRV